MEGHHCVHNRHKMLLSVLVVIRKRFSNLMFQCIINLSVLIPCMLYVLENLSDIEEYSAERGLSPQIMKIDLVSISATESSFLHSVKVP